MKKSIVVIVFLFCYIVVFSQDKEHKFIMYTAMELENPIVKQYHNSIYMRPMEGGSLSIVKIDPKRLNRFRDNVFSLGDSIITLTLREDELKRYLGFKFYARIDSVSKDRKDYYCYNKEFGRCFIYIDYRRNQVQLRLKYIPSYDLYQFIYVFLTKDDN